MKLLFFEILAEKELFRSLKPLTAILPAITPVIALVTEFSGARALSYPSEWGHHRQR